MLRQRFAINVYAVGGVVFVGVGIALVAVGNAMAAASWLLLMGAGFTVAGVVWAGLAGRMGRLRDNAKLLAEGVPAAARIVAVHATSAMTSAGEHGPVVSRVYRLDLALTPPSSVGRSSPSGLTSAPLAEDLGIHSPFRGPYQLRVYRSLGGAAASWLFAGRELPVRLHRDDPRRVAIAWHELLPSRPSTW